MKKLPALLFISILVSLIFTPIISADESMTATVPPNVSDFQFAFASTDGQSTVPQNTILSYQITYGAKSSAGVTTTTKIVADFSADTAPDGSHVLDYVVGSASNAYGGTTPVVDLNNRTITWTINNFPAGTTNQTVTFQLKTNSNYTGTTPVNFTTRAEMSNEYVTLPDQTVTQTYEYSPIPVTPTAIPVTTTPNPTVNANPTLTPTPQPTGLQITGVSFTGISNTSATLSVTTNNPATLLVSYGTSPNALLRTVSTNKLQKVSQVTLQSLSANTIYYFKITATGQNGGKITSEMFKFQTAKKAPPVFPVNGTAVFSSNGNVILTEAITKAMTPGFALLTDNTDYDLTISLSNPVTLNSLNVIVQKQTPLATVSLSQKQKGIYFASLKSLTPSTYQIILKATDDNGNIIEQPIANLKIIPHLSVYDKDTNSPITDARIFLTYYDDKSHTYKPVIREIFGTVANPVFTDTHGETNTILPPGKYRAEASALFYDGATVNFTLGLANGQEFPRIILKKNIFNSNAILLFIKDLFIDTLTNIVNLLHSLASSIRFFTIVAVITTFSFIFLSFLLFLLKSHMSFRHLPHFMLFYVALFFRKSNQEFIFGIVVDEQGKALPQVLIEVEDADSKTILTHTMTNANGKFYLPNKFRGDINLIVSKDGFAPTTYENGNLLSDLGIKIVLRKGESHNLAVSHFLTVVGSIFGMFFEVSLVLSIILELLFFSLYGFLHTITFFIFSLLNILLWLFYLAERKQSN